MVIYIHGFSSHGYGGKASAFRTYFKKKKIPFIAPSLSHIPDLTVQTLEELVKSCTAHETVGLIGSSLGGYYALYLAQKYHLKTVLINPAVRPFLTLQRALGNAPHFYDGSHFEWKESHLEMLKKYETQSTRNNENTLLLLQTGDDVLDYREALSKVQGSKQIIEEGGSHGFDGIERYFETVDDFLR